MKYHSASVRQALALSAIAIAAFAASSPSHAAWVSLPLPGLPQDFASYQSANLPDGRFLLGTTNQLAQQNAFGSASITAFDHPQPWDPSSVAIQSNTLGAVSAGMFGASGIYTFNPSDTSGTFSAIPNLSIQNYHIAFRDSAGLFVRGNNGTGAGPFGMEDSLSYVSLDGAANKVIIDNISMFSGGFAVDMNGNLFVSNDDNLKLYMFTAAQVTSAISGSPLSITSGAYVTTLRADGSIAVDSQGRIWSAGFQINGIDVYDPSNDSNTSFLPGLDNDNYVVSTFSDGQDGYVSYLNAAGSTAGSALTYGYEKASNLVPEPSTVALLALCIGALGIRRKR